ncbi:MAG: hypothetical protein QOH93_764 [Chloroflexia bacterium]|jgi:hypothetical protein|nr:hypothetical protein [Chloroflexia bacterium]
MNEAHNSSIAVSAGQGYCSAESRACDVCACYMCMPMSMCMCMCMHNDGLTSHREHRDSA